MTSSETTSNPRHVAHDTLGDRLAIEWRRLRRRPDLIDRAARWQLVDHPLTDLDELLLAIGYGSYALGATDDRLRRLVVLAAHDELAARIVIQRIVPGLLAVVRRRRRQGADEAAFQELLGAAWITIRTYNPDRRPTSVAAALVSDADYRAFRSPGRRRSATEQPTTIDDDHAVAPPPETNPAIELAELFRLAVESGVPADDLDLLRQLLTTPTVNDLARHLRITPRTVRNRRDRITLRLRQVALAA